MQAKSRFFPRAALAEQMRPQPIYPTWVVQGSPLARSLDVGTCGVFSNSIWDCTAGSFFWYYHCSESVQILEGEAVITDMAGESRVVSAGDAAMFAEGDWLHWHVPRYVRKYAAWGQPPAAVGRYLAGKVGSKIGEALAGHTGEAIANALPPLPPAAAIEAVRKAAAESAPPPSRRRFDRRAPPSAG